ncbi:P-loop containing nucleoside triphosphate hydrolase protein [Mycena amicta]|nr:P-loop containing nucleoside triphosphate hydrolase protein [Mycena amicta]
MADTSPVQAQQPAPPPPQLRRYTRDTVDTSKLKQLSEEVLGMTPFQWQLDAAVEILCGENLILDVGTGCGKSLCFVLPLLLDTNDIGISVMPLTALMLDQAKTAKIPTLAICHETIETIGRVKLYEVRTYRHIICSPEILKTKAFKSGVLNRIADRCRVVNLDEAHCISTWGGSFRPDYLELGDLRGLVPSHVPILIASATWPSNVLDEVRQVVGMPPNTRRIAISNARPNVALSVRATAHEEPSFADLRFLIPVDAKKTADIPVTLVYFNERLKAERACDRLSQWARDAGIEIPDGDECVAFYHAKVGPKRKRELEAMLAAGKVRILCCTDAVGMGCDMRNIERVILWELPPSFCALVQRAGRAARDLTKLGEAILIVSKNLINKGAKGLEAELLAVVEAAAEAAADEAEAMNESEGLDVVGPGVEVNTGGETLLVEEGGVRQSNESDDEDAEGGAKQSTRGKRGRRAKNECSEREARFLTRFACGKDCIAGVWDEFFENATKGQF